MSIQPNIVFNMQTGQFKEFEDMGDRVGRRGAVPDRNTVLRWVAAFRSTGSVMKTKPPGFPRSVRTTENVDRVRTAVLASPKRSARRQAVALGDDQRDWDIYLPQFAFAINTTRHETTGFTPAFLNFGRQLVPPKSLWKEVKSTANQSETQAQDLVPELKKLKDFYQITKSRLSEGFQRQSHHYNLRRRPFRPQVGQYVFRKEHTLSNAARNFSAKLAPKYAGPCKVLKVLSPNIVQLQLQIPGSRKKEHVHVKDLKLAQGDAEDLPTPTDTVIADQLDLSAQVLPLFETRDWVSQPINGRGTPTPTDTVIADQLDLSAQVLPLFETRDWVSL
ncbi:hypothetical protein QE152_g39225 [Popillia japonica]|uniref:DUF4817 domain-containing protein n=1 Tax=Popillia japonica TaxID=7064 RepID=A0AAW1HUD2_POPJA